jgi:hypothetical protein
MLITADMVAQRRYARDASSAPRTGLAIGPTVVRGLRDIGFRDTAAALAALIDNAIDGGASRVDIAIEASNSVPTAIAVIDNGYGMVPEMIRAACAVGVSCLLGDGPHLARNGFGLPSAPFSIGSRFDVLSCPHGNPLFGVTMDLAEIASDEVPEARRAALPMFVSGYIATYLPAWSCGTVVMMSDLDRVSPHSLVRLRAGIAQHLGFVFARFIGTIDLRIDGERVAPVDPLFLASGAVNSARWRAGDVEQWAVTIAGSEVTVATTMLAPAAIDAQSRASLSQSDQVATFANHYCGLVISRLQRRLATIATSPLFTFGNADWRVRAEIDFQPALDDLFTPALSLQQVHVAEPVWRALRAAGIGHKLESLRRKCRLERTCGQATDAPAVATHKASPGRRNRCHN